MLLKEYTVYHTMHLSNYKSTITTPDLTVSPWKFHMLRPTHFTIHFVTLFVTGMHFHKDIIIRSLQKHALIPILESLIGPIPLMNN